jgi:hypothetical protein
MLYPPELVVLMHQFWWFCFFLKSWISSKGLTVSHARVVFLINMFSTIIGCYSLKMTTTFYVWDHMGQTLDMSKLYLQVFHFASSSLKKRSIWRCRNHIIFNNVGVPNFLHVIHTATYQILLWALLLLEDQRELMANECNRMLMVAHDIYNRDDWRHSRRLQNV